MPTHYYLFLQVIQTSRSQTSEVLKTSEVSDSVSDSVSNAMMRLSVSYTKAINKRFDRVGALFQGAFQAKLIQNDNHLRNLCVYIHANPIKDGLVDAPEDWPYSNYLEWIGERNGTLVDHEFVHEHFDSPAAYRAVIMGYIKTRELHEDVSVYLQSLER